MWVEEVEVLYMLLYKRKKMLCIFHQQQLKNLSLGFSVGVYNVLTQEFALNLLCFQSRNVLCQYLAHRGQHCTKTALTAW